MHTYVQSPPVVCGGFVEIDEEPQLEEYIEYELTDEELQMQDEKYVEYIIKSHLEDEESQNDVKSA